MESTAVVLLGVSVVARAVTRLAYLRRDCTTTEPPDFLKVHSILPSSHCRLTCHCRASTICAYTRCWIRLERLLPLCGPQRSCPFTSIALELVRHPEQRSENGGAVIAG